MGWLNCRRFVLLASCLFGIVDGGHIGHLNAIQRLGFNANLSTQEANVTEDWYMTKYKIKKYTYLWTIDNFSGRPHGTGQFLNSPIFPAAANDQLKWSIALFPKGESEQNRNDISVFLMLTECKLTQGDVLARYKLSILDQQGNHCNLKDSERPIKFDTNLGIGFGLINRDNLLDTNRGLLAGDKLKIYCEIDALIEPIEYLAQVNQLKAPTQEQPSNVLEQLYETGQFSDIILAVNDKEFKAHKIILAASSLVFKERIGDDLKESQVDRLELADIRPEILEELLRFIYTGRSSLVVTEQVDQQQLAIELFKASHKYQVEPLESICERALIETMSVHSVGQLLLLTDSCNASEFKKKVMDFVVVNYRQVFETDGWRATIKEASMELIAEVNREIFK